MDAAPGRSKFRRAVSTRLSLRSGALGTSTASPTGTLMKNAHDELTALVGAPPRGTPAGPPLGDTAAQIPSALLRSRPSASMTVRIESAAGETSAAPRP